MVVAVHGLRGAARVDHVDLRGDLVAGAEPGAGDQGQDVVRVVVGERLGVVERGLLQRVPHPVVGARLCEVVPGARARRALLGDQGLEHLGGTVHDRQLREGAPEDHDAGPLGERPHQLGLHLTALPGRHGLAEPVAVVDEDVPLDRGRVREVAQVGGLLDEGTEGVEVAVLLGEPGAGFC